MKKVFKCSPELADGDRWTIAETPEQLAEFVTIWAKAALLEDNVGDSFDVELVEMSEEEIKNLPDL